METTEKSLKFYVTLGKIVWFMMRWAFYAALFYIAFSMGSKQGSVTQRVRQVEFPKIQIQFPKSTTTPTFSSASQPKTNAYVIVVGSFSDVASTQSLQDQLNQARIHNYVITDNGQFHVCVGKYTSQSRANRTLKIVKAKGFENATVVSPPAGISGTQ